MRVKGLECTTFGAYQCLTCAIPLVLYLWSHWGQCDILVWGWGRHICHFICLFVLFVFCTKQNKTKQNKNKNKKKTTTTTTTTIFAMLLIGHDLTS
jgi:hypothetical protein